MNSKNLTKFGKNAGPFLKNAIMNAKFELLVITAFIDEYGARLLANKANEGIRVATILPRSTINQKVLSILISSNIELRLMDEFIHAKIYVIDNKGYASSANLTKYALEGENIEYIVEIPLKEAREIFINTWRKAKLAQMPLKPTLIIQGNESFTRPSQIRLEVFLRRCVVFDMGV